MIQSRPKTGAEKLRNINQKIWTLSPRMEKKKKRESAKVKEISSYSEPQGVVHEAPGSPETVVESVLVPVREKTALTTCTFIK